MGDRERVVEVQVVPCQVVQLVGQSEGAPVEGEPTENLPLGSQGQQLLLTVGPVAAVDGVHVGDAESQRKPAGPAARGGARPVDLHQPRGLEPGDSRGADIRRHEGHLRVRDELYQVIDVAVEPGELEASPLECTQLAAFDLDSAVHGPPRLGSELGIADDAAAVAQELEKGRWPLGRAAGCSEHEPTRRQTSEAELLTDERARDGRRLFSRRDRRSVAHGAVLQNVDTRLRRELEGALGQVPGDPAGEGAGDPLPAPSLLLVQQAAREEPLVAKLALNPGAAHGRGQRPAGTRPRADVECQIVVVLTADSDLPEPVLPLVAPDARGQADGEPRPAVARPGPFELDEGETVHRAQTRLGAACHPVSGNTARTHRVGLTQSQPPTAVEVHDRPQRHVPLRGVVVPAVREEIVALLPEGPVVVEVREIASGVPQAAAGQNGVAPLGLVEGSAQRNGTPGRKTEETSRVPATRHERAEADLDAGVRCRVRRAADQVDHATEPAGAEVRGARTSIDLDSLDVVERNLVEIDLGPGSGADRYSVPEHQHLCGRRTADGNRGEGLQPAEPAHAHTRDLVEDVGEGRTGRAFVYPDHLDRGGFVLRRSFGDLRRNDDFSRFNGVLGLSCCHKGQEPAQQHEVWSKLDQRRTSRPLWSRGVARADAIPTLLPEGSSFGLARSRSPGFRIVLLAGPSRAADRPTVSRRSALPSGYGYYKSCFRPRLQWRGPRRNLTGFPIKVAQPLHAVVERGVLHRASGCQELTTRAW